MKKILLLLFVTALFQVNAQISPSNPVTNTLILNASDHYLYGNAITVPDGKFWVINEFSNNYWRIVSPDDNEFYPFRYMYIPGGSQVYVTNPHTAFMSINEYNYSTGETLSYNDVEPLKDRIKLFPNPTTNQLALNSEKVYQIEVFDLTGNKVMELKGNTINVEHLSSATYIVNAIDLETKESLSYKVVKK